MKIKLNKVLDGIRRWWLKRRLNWLQDRELVYVGCRTSNIGMWCRANRELIMGNGQSYQMAERGAYEMLIDHPDYEHIDLVSADWQMVRRFKVTGRGFCYNRFLNRAEVHQEYGNVWGEQSESTSHSPSVCCSHNIPSQRTDFKQVADEALHREPELEGEEFWIYARDLYVLRGINEVADSILSERA